MKALLVATGYCPDNPLNTYSPALLLPLVDRPFIQHVVEFLVDQGVSEFDFILSHFPEKIEQFLGDGTRWGSTFRFHLAREASRPLSVIKALPLGNAEESILLVHADRLPQVLLAQTNPLLTKQRGPVVYFWLNQDDAPDQQTQWTGWAWLSGTALTQLANEDDNARFATRLWALGHQQGALVEVPKPLSVESCSELLIAHQAVLAKQFSGLRLKGREIESGVWVSRNVRLHPTARIIPPVYIGENCWVEEHVQLGPHAVLGRNCVINPQSAIMQSVVLPGSYVGEGLELADTLVDRNRLVNVRVGSEVTVLDDFILGSLLDQSLSQNVQAFLSRAGAIFLLAVLWPVLLVTALYLKVIRHGPVLFRTEVYASPVSPGESRWNTFWLWSFCPSGSSIHATDGRGQKPGWRSLLLNVLPALVNIAKGELHFVGVTPQTKEEDPQTPS